LIMCAAVFAQSLAVQPDGSQVFSKIRLCARVQAAPARVHDSGTEISGGELFLKNSAPLTKFLLHNQTFFDLSYAALFESKSPIATNWCLLDCAAMLGNKTGFAVDRHDGTFELYQWKGC